MIGLIFIVLVAGGALYLAWPAPAPHPDASIDRHEAAMAALARVTQPDPAHDTQETP